MRNALKPGTIITVNGVEYTIKSLLNANGGMSLIYEATQRVDQGGFAGNTVIKEFFPTTLAARNGEGRVICTSEDPEELRRFEELRRSMVDEGVIGEEARVACSQVYAFDHAEDGYAVMRKFSEDTRSLVDLLNAWQVSPPTSDEEYTDMARLRYALRICHSILTGLQTIHDRAGIIHRDISLGNIVWASSDITKEGKDGRAYFLDFGSALKMNERREARNTTDPLKLFGTYSFAAPEIWQLGATLTPAVDLFSISAILLLLCCGKKCCIRMKQGWHLASQANAGRLYESNFVVKGAVEKLNIPAEIRGMLMDFLLEGLYKAPERRFNQSPAAMLEALERLQIKCTPRQRLREYAAFISYHHRPLDKAVARRLHRMIERYRIPAELAKDQESRKLGLVFRDEDELPVSTDLTDNIQEALDHSDYLIVICTPGTPKSIWVEAEIAYFLRHHDRNHVLAVLAEGRPEESFPPHLVHLYDTEGNIIGDTEYLAANIAANSRQETLRRLNREKLRIIAAMLGCPYDSLYQREKHYQIRRAAIAAGSVAVLLIAFISVILVKNHQLDLQYRETLINESYALSRAAQLEYQQGNTIGALEYALEAVPTEDNERPYTVLSEQVLNDVLTPYSFGQCKVLSAIEQDTDIISIQINQDDTAIYALDRYGQINAYAIESSALLWTYRLDMESLYGSTNSIAFIDGINAILAHSDRELCLINSDTGTVIWRMDAYLSSVQVSEDRSAVAVFGGFHNADMQTVVGIQFLSMKDGSVQRSVNCSNALVSVSGFTDLCSFVDDGISERCFEGKDRFFGISYGQSDTDNSTYEMKLYCVEKAAMPRILLSKSSNRSAEGFFTRPIALHYSSSDDSLLLVCINAAEQCISLEKISASDGACLHTQVYPWETTREPSKICFLSTETHAFLTLNNDLFCFDVETGELLAKSLDLSRDFIGMYPVPGFDAGCYVSNEGGWYGMVVCRSGAINYSNFRSQCLHLGSISLVLPGRECCFSPSEQMSFSIGYVVDLNPDGLVAVCPQDNSNRIIIYKPRVAWGSYLEGLEVGSYEYLLDDSGRFVLDRNDRSIYDLESGETIPLSGMNPWTNYDDIAISTESHTVSYLQETGICVYSLDKKISSNIDLPEIEEVLPLYICNHVAMKVMPDGSTLIVAFNGKELYCWKDGQEIPVEPGSTVLSQFWLAVNGASLILHRVVTDGRFVVIGYKPVYMDEQAGGFLIYDIEKQEWKTILQSPGYTCGINNIEYSVCISRQTGKMALMSDEYGMLIYDLASASLDYKVEFGIPTEAVRDIRFVDNDRKLVLLTDAQIIAFDMESATIRTLKYEQVSQNVRARTEMWNIAENQDRRFLYLGHSLGSTEGICINIDTWTPVAQIPYLISYLPNSNELLIYDYPGMLHPHPNSNVLMGVDKDKVPEGTYGICKVPVLAIEELSRQGREVLHMIRTEPPEEKTSLDER